jgi:hypothetical protein
MHETTQLTIEKDLVEPYPSVALRPIVAAWCLAHFKSPFAVIRIREDLYNYKTNIKYWVWGAAIIGSIHDMVALRLICADGNVDHMIQTMKNQINQSCDQL